MTSEPEKEKGTKVEGMTSNGVEWHAEWFEEHARHGEPRPDDDPVSEGWKVHHGAASVESFRSPPAPRRDESNLRIIESINAFVEHKHHKSDDETPPV